MMGVMSAAGKSREGVGLTLSVGGPGGGAVAAAVVAGTMSVLVVALAVVVEHATMHAS